MVFLKDIWLLLAHGLRGKATCSRLGFLYTVPTLGVDSVPVGTKLAVVTG